MITKTTLTIGEAAETLDGFEEEFIAEQCDDLVIEDLLTDRPRIGLRILAACVVARDLTGDDARVKAYEHVKSLTMKQINEFFAAERADGASEASGEAGEQEPTYSTAGLTEQQ